MVTTPAMNLRLGMILALALMLASGQAISAPGGKGGKGGDDGSGGGGSGGSGSCAATASHFPALGFVRVSGPKNRQKDIMLASVDGTCLVSVYMTSDPSSDIQQVELLSEHGLLAWSEYAPVSRDITRTTIKLLRFTVEAGNAVAAGTPQVLWEVYRDARLPREEWQYIAAGSISLSGDGARLAFRHSKGWAAYETMVHTLWICELADCGGTAQGTPLPTATASTEKSYTYNQLAWGHDPRELFILRGEAPYGEHVVLSVRDSDSGWTLERALVLAENGDVARFSRLSVTREGTERLAVNDRNPETEPAPQVIRVYARNPHSGAWDANYTCAIDCSRETMNSPQWSRRGTLATSEHSSLLFRWSAQWDHLWEWNPQSGSDGAAGTPSGFGWVYDAD